MYYKIGVLHHIGERDTVLFHADSFDAIRKVLENLLRQSILSLSVDGRSAERDNETLREHLRFASQPHQLGSTLWFTVTDRKIGDLIGYAHPADQDVVLKLPKPPRPLPPAIERQPVESSNLRSVGYDSASETLDVEFANTMVFRYLDVPVDAHAELMAAASIGSHFAKAIRGKYLSEKLTGEKT